MGVCWPPRRRTSPSCLRTTPPTRLNRYIVHLSVLGKDNIHFSYTPHPFICIFCRSLETLVWCTAGWAPITGCSSAEPERWHRLAEKFWETCFFHSPTSRTTTLCITRRSPRRSWCTEWRSLCRSTPSLAGYPSSSCHHLDFILYHLSSISSMIISR